MNEFISNIKSNYKKILFKTLTIIVVVYWVLFLLCGLVVIVDKHFLYPIRYEKQVITYSKEYDLDTAFVYSIINTESRFNSGAVSSKGAIGLMQIKESTADYIASMLGTLDYDLFDPNCNISFGCYYLRYLYNKFNSLTLVACAYNAGEGNVSHWLENEEYSVDGKTLLKIPFPETNEYVKRVKKSFNKYKKLYPHIVDKPVEFE